MKKQYMVLGVIGAAVAAAVWFEMRRAETVRKQGVLLTNYKAVDHFEKYGGGF